MSKIVKYNHKTIQEVKALQIKDIDPAEVDFSKIRRTASAIKRYLQDDGSDLWVASVKARGAMHSVSECLRIASQMFAFYHSEAKKQYSIAKLERADKWFEKNKPDTKLTDGNRSSYADMDEEFQVAKQREYAAKGLVEYLRNKHKDFVEDLNLAKKKMVVDGVDRSKAGYDNIDDEDEYEG